MGSYVLARRRMNSMLKAAKAVATATNCASCSPKNSTVSWRKKPKPKRTAPYPIAATSEIDPGAANHLPVSQRPPSKTSTAAIS